MKRVCLYGQTCAAFVEPVVGGLRRAFAECGAELVPLTIESAIAGIGRWTDVESVYVLPFDIPWRHRESLTENPPDLIRRLFPGALIENSMAAHDLCHDKVATARRLLGRGVPLPDTLITDDPDEVLAFVREHEHVILKETHSCGGHGHLVLTYDDTRNLVSAANRRHYLTKLLREGTGRRLEDGVLSVAPPFYTQRLITDIRGDGSLAYAQLLRAYVVDGQIPFWTERYRNRVEHPSDFIVNATFGARYRMLHRASDEAHKIAVRSAEVVGMRFGVVDLVRTGSAGPFVLELDTDGQHLMIDRSFQQLPEWRSVFDFDRYVAEAITAPVVEMKVTKVERAIKR